MKVIIFLLTTFLIGNFAISQNTKLDSVSLINNTLYQYKGGSGTTRGAVQFPPSSTSVLRYDSAYGSYYTQNAGIATAHPGSFNIAIGDGVLDSVIVNGRAFANVLIGQRVMATGGIGTNNVGIGWEALRENRGNDNVGISEDALRDNRTGIGNVAIGRGAMNYNINGRSNMAVGYNALQAGLHNNENVTMGDYSGAFLVTGDGNVFIGSYAGESNGSDNVVQNDGVAIGRYAGIGGAIGNRSICLGYNTQTNGDDQLNIGNAIIGTKINGVTGTKIELKGDSVIIGKRQIWFDDFYMYVRTVATGVTNKVPLQALVAQARPIQEQSQTLGQPKKYIAYTTSGQALYLVELK